MKLELFQTKAPEKIGMFYLGPFLEPRNNAFIIVAPLKMKEFEETSQKKSIVCVLCHEREIMDKALEMGKTSTVGSVQLFLGTSISTIIRALGAIVLGLYILPGDYGLYAIALIPGTTLALLQDWGIGSAITRYCAKYRATNELGEQRKVVIAGLIFEAVTGLVFSIISLLLASFFASTIFGKPDTAFLIALVSVTMLSGAISTGVAAVFTGFEQMKLNSYLNLVGAIVYSSFAPLLVFLGYGAVGAIIGFTLSSVVQGILSVVFLYSFTLRKLSGFKTSMSEIVFTLKSMLSFGVPLGFSSIVSNLGSPFFSFLMGAYVSEVAIGNYKIAGNFLVLLTFLTTPITVVLFPAFSKLDPRSESNLLKTVFASSVKYTNLLLVPATMVLFVLATPIIGTLYGDRWSLAPSFLALMAIFYLLSLFGLRSMGSLLSAIGETRLLLEMACLSLVISIPVAFLLVPSLGIIGMIVGLQVSAFPSTFIGLYLIWKRYGVKADFGASVKIFLSSALAAVTVYLFLVYFNAYYWVSLLVGLILYFVVYLISAPLLGAITRSDITNLRTLFSGLGIVSRLLEIPLKILDRLLRTRDS